MSYKNIQELTLRLSSALDQNYNVLKLEEVFSVINALESTSITKDQLETTRLAKYINQLRRRTTNEQLAKKAKCLLKKWREKLLASNDNKKTNVHHTSFKISNHHNNSENNALSDYSQNFHLNHGHSTFRRHTTQSSLPSIDCNNFTNLSKSTSGSQAKPSMSTEILSYDVIDNTNSGFDDEVMSVPLSHSNKNFNNSNNNIKSVNDVPIVIDLHDTNSMDMSMATNIPIVSREFSIGGELSAIGQIVSSPNSRHSRSKRKNINLEYEDTIVYSTTNTTSSTAATPIQQRDNEIAVGAGVGGAGVGGAQDTKTHSLYNLSISDILSLSNSSMGSEKQRCNEVAKENSLNLKQSTSDLTFAGKFKKKCINTANCLTNSTNSNNEFSGFNYFGNNEKDQLESAHQKFAPFASLMSINSNDSTASSRRIPNFDMNQEQHNKSANIATVTGAPTETIITPTKIALNETPNNKVEVKDNRSENSVGKGSSEDLKVPKKRGRKKGSKGVDAIIAKETSLSSEMLIRGSMSCKKVKTTKELYAEMKNRKFGLNSSPSPQGYSEPSIHSPRTLETFSSNAVAISPNVTNRCTTENTALLHIQPSAVLEKEREAVESDCFTLTSEPSIDSAPLIKSDVDNNCINANSMLIDSNSNSVALDIAPPVQSNVITTNNSYHTSIATVKEQLYEIIYNLPPMLNYHDIEIECQAHVVPCTCRVIQIPNHIGDITDYENGALKVVNSKNNNSNKGSGKSNDILDLKEAENKVKHNVIIVEDGKKEQAKQTPIITKKVVPKSIFDVDFDDDNDPLPTIIADLKANQFKLEHSNKHSTTHNSSDVTSSEKATFVKDETINSGNNTTNHIIKMKLSPSTPVEQLPPAPIIESIPALPLPSVPLKSLIAEIDDKCPAKYRFEVQTQNITEFHINVLHNFYIPNVNGNWNEAFVLGPPPQYTVAASSPLSFHTFTDSTEKIDGCSVVPKYGALIKESLIKNLSQVSWSELKINQTCKKNDDSYGELKFFGVIQTPKNNKDIGCKKSKNNSLYNNKSLSNENSTQLADLTTKGWSNSKCDNRERKLSISKINDENKLSILSRNIKKINEDGSGNKNTTTKCLEYILQKKNNNKRRKQSVATTLTRNNGKHLGEKDKADKEEAKKGGNEKEAEQHNHQDSHSNCNSHSTNYTTETFQMNLNTSSLSPRQNDSNHSNISCDKDNQTTVTHFTRNSQILDKMPFHENESNMHHEKQFQGRRKRRKKFNNQCYKKEKKIHNVLFFHDELRPTSNSDDYVLNINNSNSNCNASINSNSNNNSNINNARSNSSCSSNDFSGSSGSEVECSYSDDDDKDDYTENDNIFTQNHQNVNNNNSAAECCSVNQKLDNANVNVDNVDNADNADNVDNVDNADNVDNIDNIDNIGNVGNVVNANVDAEYDNYDDLLNVLKHCNEKLGNSDVTMEDDDINLNAIITVTATTTTSTTTIITSAMPTATVITAATPLYQQNNIQNSYDIENEKSNENINNYNNENDNYDNDENTERKFRINRDKLLNTYNNAQLLSINKIYQETKLQIKDDNNVGCVDNSLIDYKHQETMQQLTTTTTTTTTTTPKPTTITATATTTTNYNNNDKEHLLPLPEYRNGWRQVNEGINNCQHWQQFAEWHQVLQLRSYNNELLTVLPYVIIE